MAEYSGKKPEELFKKVKLLILDVDGVLTRGEIIYDSEGRDLKVFNVKDGLGVFLLGKAGVPTILVTAKNSKVVKLRAKDMKAAGVYAGILPKERLLPVIQRAYNIKPEHMCFVGDDLIDIGIMRRVGVPVAVADAPGEVKRVACYITRQKGGEGAVREVVDRIISSQKLAKKIIALVDTLR